MTAVKVDLAWGEVRLACMAGLERRLCAIHWGYQDRYGAPSAELGWQLDIQGMLAEYVYAKAAGLFWPGADPHQHAPGDVARIQVRSTPREDGSLIIRPHDPDAAAFVLVVGGPKSFRIPGWLPGAEGKQAGWLRAGDRDPAYFVPQSALRPLSELVDT